MYITFGLLVVAAFLESSNMHTADWIGGKNVILTIHSYQACENWPSEHKNIGWFTLSLFCCNLTIYTSYGNEIFITTADFNELSSAAYENEILYS